MSYRFDPLAPAAARYSWSSTTRAVGCLSSSAWMAASSPPAPGVGQAKWSSQGRPQATETARSRAAQVLPALS
jgi:hypothetical protein